MVQHDGPIQGVCRRRLCPARRLLVSLAAVTAAACAAPMQRAATVAPPAAQARVTPTIPANVGRPTVGVAFGGGSARGIAHVGVIKWLEEHRIPIDVAAGTSMGGLVGGAFASGMEAQRARSVHRVARLGSAVRRLLLRAQEHPPQGRRARLSGAPRIRVARRDRAADLVEQRRARRAAPGPHRRAVLHRRRLRRAADAVSHGGGGSALGPAGRDAQRVARRCDARHHVAAADLSARGDRRTGVDRRRDHEQRARRRRQGHGRGSRRRDQRRRSRPISRA